MRVFLDSDLPWLHMLGRLTEHYYINQHPLSPDCDRIASAWEKSLSLLHSQVLDAIKYRELDQLFGDTADALVRASDMLVKRIILSGHPDAEVAAGFAAFSSRVRSYARMLGFELFEE